MVPIQSLVPSTGWPRYRVSRDRKRKLFPSIDVRIGQVRRKDHYVWITTSKHPPTWSQEVIWLLVTLGVRASYKEPIPSSKYVIGVNTLRCWLFRYCGSLHPACFLLVLRLPLAVTLSNWIWDTFCARKLQLLDIKRWSFTRSRLFSVTPYLSLL